MMSDRMTNTPTEESPPDLESSLEEVVTLLAMALNNRFHEALQLCDKWLVFCDISLKIV